MKKWITIGIIAFVAIIMFFASATIVPAGSTGVIVHLGRVSNDTLAEGFHLKAPFIERVEKISNKVQILELDSSAVSRDLQTVNTDIAINFRLASNTSASMYQNVGTDYQSILIIPAAQESLKVTMAQYSAENLIVQRDEVSEKAKDTLNARLNEYGIYIEKFAISNMDFTKEFNDAIEQKQISEQNKLRAETEKEQKIIEAEAEAESKRIAAQGRADALLIEAEATASANKTISASIDDKVLMYKQLETWSGELPKVVSGDGNGFMFDVSTVVAEKKEIVETSKPAEDSTETNEN